MYPNPNPRRYYHENSLFMFLGHPSLCFTESKLRAWDGVSSNFNRKIGFGLFAGREFKRGERIGYFVGLVMSRAKFEEEVKAGYSRRGYQINLPKGELLDCSQCMEFCYPSKANTPRGSINLETGRATRSNARIVVDPKTKRVSLKATGRIGKHREIVVAYSKAYKI